MVVPFDFAFVLLIINTTVLVVKSAFLVLGSTLMEVALPNVNKYKNASFPNIHQC